MQDLAPIILFVYNRPSHTKKTIEALKNNTLANQSILYIFSDGSKYHEHERAVNEVRNYIRNINGFRDIIIRQRTENYGLAKSVIEGINEVLNNYDKVIVLEDDIETTPKFLKFMNNCLEFYKEISSVYSISGYSFAITIPANYNKDIYFLRRSSSWGWATWKNRWEKARWDNSFYKEKIKNKIAQKDFNIGGEDLTPMLIKQINNEIDSWAIRWAFTHYLYNGNCVFPVKSLAQNIGTDATGTHFNRKTTRYNVDLDYSNNEIKLTDEVKINSDIERQVRKIVNPGIITRIINYILALVTKIRS